jgi:hypothetical protein
MSYRFQFPDDVPNRPLDYSRERLPTITETALNEPTGISGPHGLQTAFGLGAVTPLPADAPIDWNADGDANDTNVSANINDGGGNNGNGCNGDGTVLQGHNDWPVLLYDFRNSPDFADGVHNTSATVDEQTHEQAIAGGSGGTVPPPGGGQPPPGGNCADTLRPSAKVTRGSRGFKATRGRLTIAGTANDASPCASKGRVARVEVAVARKLGKRCRFLNAKGRAGRARSCHKPVFLKAKGTSRWTLTIKRLPARGTYVVVVRARDASGNVGRALTRTRRLTRH